MKGRMNDRERGEGGWEGGSEEGGKEGREEGGTFDQTSQKCHLHCATVA